MFEGWLRNVFGFMIPILVVLLCEVSRLRSINTELLCEVSRLRNRNINLILAPKSGDFGERRLRRADYWPNSVLASAVNSNVISFKLLESLNPSSFRISLRKPSALFRIALVLPL